jgi:hypothetical protein
MEPGMVVFGPLLNGTMRTDGRDLRRLRQSSLRSCDLAIIRILKSTATTCRKRLISPCRRRQSHAACGSFLIIGGRKRIIYTHR